MDIGLHYAELSCTEAYILGLFLLIFGAILLIFGALLLIFRAKFWIDAILLIFGIMFYQ